MNTKQGRERKTFPHKEAFSFSARCDVKEKKQRKNYLKGHTHLMMFRETCPGEFSGDRPRYNSNLEIT